MSAQPVEPSTDYRPYRYLDAPRRHDEPFTDLDALARDLHAVRRGRGLRLEPWQDRWEFGEGEHRAGLRAHILDRDGAVAETRHLLTAGEDADELGQALHRTRPAKPAKAA